MLELSTQAERRARTMLEVGSRPVPARVGGQVIVTDDQNATESAEISGTSAFRRAMLVEFTKGGLLFISFAWLSAAKHQHPDQSRRLLFAK